MLLASDHLLGLPLQKNDFPVLEFVQIEEGMAKAMERNQSMNVEVVLANVVPLVQPLASGDGYSLEV